MESFAKFRNEDVFNFTSMSGGKYLIKDIDLLVCGIVLQHEMIDLISSVLFECFSGINVVQTTYTRHSQCSIGASDKR